MDAFAGAGRDETGAAGSPVIAAEIARSVNLELFGASSALDEGMRIVAIEIDPSFYTQLNANLAPYQTPPPPIAIVRRGTLQELAVELLGHIVDDPTFFFLDPFGVDGLDASILPRLLAASHSELLILLSDEGAVRLHGKAQARIPTREELEEQRERNPSIFGEDFDAQLKVADRIAVERVLAGHQSNARAEQILARALGGDWWKGDIQATPIGERRHRFVDLYAQILLKSGAEFVLPFAVTTAAGRHKYTLIHASKNIRAFAAMKDAMHRARQKRTSPNDTISLFEHELTSKSQQSSPMLESGANLKSLVDEISRHFANREVRWTTGKYTEDTVKSYARDYTPLLFHEFDELQKTLDAGGFCSCKRPLTYRFPAM